MSDALEILKRYSRPQQLAILEALDKKRREEHFVKYWTPQPQQKEHFKEFTQDVKIFGILGGNRSGKTEEGVFIDVAWALGKDYFKGEPVEEFVNMLPIPPPPNNIWVVGLDFGVLKNVIWHEKLRYGRSHPPFLPKDSEVILKVNDGEFQVFFTNGSIITGKSADAGWEKFQGASVDLVHIDEECESRVFNECFQRTADCAGKILLTLTPLVDIASGVKEPWVYDTYEEMVQGRKDIKFVKLNVMDNPYVPEPEKVLLQKKWSGHPEEKARLYGDFIQRSGMVYNLWNREKHVITPRILPKEWRRIVSIDPAATGVTAAVIVAVEPGTNNLYIEDEYYQNNLLVSEHCKNILAKVGGLPVDMWLLDPTWGTQRNAETHKTGLQLYRDNGIPARLPNVGSDFGLNVSREYIGATLDPNSRSPKVFVFDNCKNFIFEVTHYTWDFIQRGPAKGLSKDKPRKKDDHLMNCLQYLCSQRPRGRRSNSRPTDDAGKAEYARINSY